MDDTNDVRELKKQLLSVQAELAALRKLTTDNYSTFLGLGNGDSERNWYLDEANKEHAENTKYKLYGDLIAAVALIYVGFVDYYLLQHPATAQNIGTALVLGSFAIPALVLVYMMSICYRNSATHSHLAAINKHHYHSLRTYDLLLKSTSDPNTKSAILQQLATSIFLFQDSGYLANGGDSLQFSAVGDMVKSISGKG